MEQLHEELEGLLRKQFSLKIQHATGQLANSSELKSTRLSIARIKTIIKEKEKSYASVK